MMEPTNANVLASEGLTDDNEPKIPNTTNAITVFTIANGRRNLVNGDFPYHNSHHHCLC
jgi:hypothetical protein